MSSAMNTGSGGNLKEYWDAIYAHPEKLQGGFVRTLEITTDNKDMPKVVIPVAAKVVK